MDTLQFLSMGEDPCPNSLTPSTLFTSLFTKMSPRVLPQELLVEILSWVPVKDLMRFRCVSKWLCSLVLDPTFVKLHLQRSPKNTHILLTYGDKHNRESRYCTPCSIHDLLHNPSSTIEACHPLDTNVYRVLGVCNGLVCLLASHRYKYEEEYWVRFWNPATRVMSQDSPRIPLRSSDYNSPYFFMFGFGFGYDDWSDTYQVVHLDNKSQKMDVRVHSLGNNCWRNTLTFPSFPILSLHGAPVSGTVNWVALPNFSSYHQWETGTINELVIFSYDLKNESYKYFSMPDGHSEVPPRPPVLMVLKGCLCLSHRLGGTHFDFWLMKEFGVEKSWTHLLNISYDQLNIQGHIYGFRAHPVILCMSEDDDVMLLENAGRGMFILYNKRDKSVERYGDWDKGRFHFLSYDYVQSLVMPYRN